MKFGLLGYQIAYSLSPVIHRMLGGHDIDYKILDIAPERFDKEIEDAVSGLSGFNVTIPYKESIMSHCHQIDPVATRIGAVNTIDIHEGVWMGYNTDYLGFIRSIQEDIPDYLYYFPVIVGYGGVAKAVAFGLEKLAYSAFSVLGGISDTERQHFIDSIINNLNMNIMNDLPDIPIMWINCTPVGGSKVPVIPENYLPLKKGDFLFDLNYSPLPTYLEKQVLEMGISTMNGIKMLVYQAAEAQQIWKKEKGPITIDPELIINSIAELNNVS